MKIPQELIEVLRLKTLADTVAYLATANSHGSPNVSVQPFTDVIDDEYVVMPDLCAAKTKVNLNENPVATLTVAWPEGADEWVLGGRCGVFQWGHPPSYRFGTLQAGPVLQRWGDWCRLEQPADLPEELRPTVIAQRGVLVLKVEQVLRAGESP